jgi:hypothetical protein
VTSANVVAAFVGHSLDEPFRFVDGVVAFEFAVDVAAARPVLVKLSAAIACLVPAMNNAGSPFVELDIVELFVNNQVLVFVKLENAAFVLLLDTLKKY